MQLKTLIISSIMRLAENGRSIEDYVLSIDFAKELCMMSQCEKGKQFCR